MGWVGRPVSWPPAAGSTTPRALPRRAAQQLVRGAAGGGEVVGQMGGVEGAGAGDLAVQAPPHAHQELLDEGRQGGLAGDPARLWPFHPECGDGGWLGLLPPIFWTTC